ncbi:insulin-induced protein-domain-containing protein [Pseudomassariella vexata]|uniref:Insulin-induced protein-domain-containing protein n=1 Tax=Pseudomassariella vexata TaxID=1141098 RepID=A0A1Y2EEF0_9PEZI|nr:insulin-induced protein-domain-containing protein [Pseudomassariella vexata]ORY69949.1 insulin-induced protein-domain-containing protein [Pseudomassariella vexata]
MSKRKRGNASNGTTTEEPVITKKPKTSDPITIQIVAGSYDRVLHGVTATISTDDEVEFADTFLFNAHNSAVRCLAISPPSEPEPNKAQKVMLATGSTDERINVYNISAHPPSRKSQDMLSAVAPRKILENHKNREIGTLLHHSSTVTQLSFPTKSKLISSSEDSTIAVTRTRDWSLLSSIKVPKPKPQGRPSGDTAALDGTPAGVNDFAIHPSMKLMISVSKGEHSMRLWNLMTAKKAGVLNFGRDTLQDIGEGRHLSGEGRNIIWDTTGEEFCVGFDRNLLVFGMDGTPKCKVMSEPKTKIHKICYIATDTGEDDGSLLAVSTEDGRIMFFSTKAEDLTSNKATEDKKTPQLSVAKLVAQLGGKEAGVSGRIKDFAVLRTSDEKGDGLHFACGSSDGKLRVFKLSIGDLNKARKSKKAVQMGKLLGSYDTQNRITCVEAFVMIPRPDGVEDSDEEFEDISSEDEAEEEEEEEHHPAYQMAKSHEGAPILRPIPRRPFDVNFIGPIPTDDDDDESLPPTPQRDPNALNLESLNSRLLGTKRNGDFDSAPASGSLSRAQSIMNLTSSTLFGIYSPTTSGQNKFFAEQDEPSTPWGTGAETPARRINPDEGIYEVQKERGHVLRRRSSLHPPPRMMPPSKPAAALYIGLRALLLFGLGTLYGALVARFQDGRKFSALQMEDMVQPQMYDWKYLTFWGVSGVVLGSLLPWFDGVWEDVFGNDDAVESAAEHTMGCDSTESEPDTDWALVVRGIGAFVGIVFAIRKLPWASTLQVSLTLALANPCLWYLIDRSKPGFLFSAAVGLAGTALLMGLNPDMVPTPASQSSFGASIAGSNVSSSDSTLESPPPTMMLGGLASQETIESSIWTLSVLFCCCVCFGNIGRRLALNRSASAKGRWAERKP